MNLRKLNKGDLFDLEMRLYVKKLKTSLFENHKYRERIYSMYSRVENARIR